MLIEITDLTNPQLSVFSKLTETQLRNRLEPEKGIFIAESPKVIKLALQSGCKPISLLMERKHITGDGAEIINICGDIPVYTADRQLLSNLTGYTLTRGVLCAMKRPQLRTLQDVCADAGRVVVMDGVVDATNIGAVIRSAAALGIDCVLLTHTCCDPLCRRAVRVSMGTVFQIPWAWTDYNWQTQLHNLGFRIAAMALKQNAIPLDSPILSGQDKLAIVLGTEGDGLSNEVISKCDYTVYIPMHHQVDSLNVAAASAVAFWQLQKHNRIL